MSTYDYKDNVAVDTLGDVYGIESEHYWRYGNCRMVWMHLANWGRLRKGTR